jgi:hypothetical protein
VNSHTNFPSFTEQQQEEVTFLPVSLQIILEAANPVGAASTTAAINPKIACFIESPPLDKQTYFSSMKGSIKLYRHLASRSTGKSSLIISAKPDGVGAASQRLIPTGERSELPTHIATTESVSLCMRMKS